MGLCLEPRSGKREFSENGEKIDFPTSLGLFLLLPNTEMPVALVPFPPHMSHSLFRQQWKTASHLLGVYVI